MNTGQWIRSHPALLIVMLVILLWCLIGLLVAHLSGWHQLGKLYGSSRKNNGRKWRMKSIGMRRGQNYQNIVTIGANIEGIFLSVFPLFRFGHQPLFIPWDQITYIKKRWYFIEHNCLTFKRVEKVFMVLPSQVLCEINEIQKLKSNGV
jgi:hypothetical protein